MGVCCELWDLLSCSCFLDTLPLPNPSPMNPSAHLVVAMLGNRDLSTTPPSSRRWGVAMVGHSLLWVVVSPSASPSHRLGNPIGREPRQLSGRAPSGWGVKFANFSVSFFYLNLSTFLVPACGSCYAMRMSTIYSYEQFLVFVAQEHAELKAGDDTLRYGQTYFNCLWEFRSNIANAIRATKYDPFHKDEVHPDIHVHVKELWDDMNAEVLKGM